MLGVAGSMNAVLNILLVVGAATATLGGFAAAIVYQLDFWRHLRLLRKEASRFQMFAVRDQLIRLVSEKKMAESEPAWRCAYTAVNRLLSMHAKLRLHEVIEQYLQFTVAETVSDTVKSRARKIRGELNRAAKRYPGFGKAMVQFEGAFRAMVMIRTDFWSRLRLRVFVLRLSLPLPFRPKLVVRVPRPSVRLAWSSSRQAHDVGHARVAAHARQALRKPRSGEIASFAADGLRASC